MHLRKSLETIEGLLTNLKTDLIDAKLTTSFSIENASDHVLDAFKVFSPDTGELKLVLFTRSADDYSTTCESQRISHPVLSHFPGGFSNSHYACLHPNVTLRVEFPLTKGKGNKDESIAPRFRPAPVQ